ncbi:MAG: tetratricopeptide repeat protein [Planctomycetota bacterium]|nr:tetratricopeptide repeat protein [Planctomycetota bacterium]
MAGIGVGVWYAGRVERLLESARAEIAINPRLALQLAEDAWVVSDHQSADAALLRTRALGRLGRWTEALGSFAAIQDTSQYRVDDLLALVEDARKSGQTLLARLAVEAAVKASPNAQTIKLMIAVQQELGDTSEALRWCDEWQRLEVDNPEAWIMRGEVLLASRESALAAAALRTALRMQPTADVEPRIRNSLLTALLDSGDAAAARGELEWIDQRTDWNPSFGLRNARLLRLEGEFQAGLTEVKRILDVEAGSHVALFMRGVLRFDLQEFTAAAEDFEAVLRMTPNNKEAHFKLAQAYQQLGQTSQSDLHFQRSRQLGQWAVRLQEVRRELANEPHNTDLLEEAQLLQRRLQPSSGVN